MRLPDLVRVRQRFPAHPAIDVAARLGEQLDAMDLAGRITPGARVALTAGSRGVRDIVPVLRTLAARVRAAGGSPFVVPCMGSHGGATAEGQAEVLRSLGVTEDGVGAPVVSSMDVVPAGESRFGAPVWVARDLAQADAVIVVNRVKPHTDFFGPIESGLVKMLVIGVGKQAGAAEAHRLAIRHGFPAVLEEHARVALALPPGPLRGRADRGRDRADGRGPRARSRRDHHARARASRARARRSCRRSPSTRSTA